MEAETRLGATELPRRDARLGKTLQSFLGYLGSVVGGRVLQPGNCIRLRTLLPLNDVELHVIALFQCLVTIQLNCRVVDENIRPVITSDESVALGVVEPLDFAFVLSHRVCLSCLLGGW
jgi:hypothetical protein